MENLWSLFVGYIQEGLFILAQLYGGNLGLAIITLSLMVRLALMPIAMRTMRKNQARQQKLKEIQSELDRLKKRYRNSPEKLSQKTMDLYKKHDIQMMDGFGIFSNLLQLPVFMGVFSAIRQGLENAGRFLWIPDISQPNILLAFIVALLTFGSSALTPSSQEQVKVVFMLLPAVLTLLFAWRVSAGVGLYWATSSLVGIAQNVILRHKPLKK
jgi:YidC/Oxa1 family membrane protein insertase